MWLQSNPRFSRRIPTSLPRHPGAQSAPTNGEAAGQGTAARKEDVKIPYAKRTYRPYFPDILEARTDQFVFEFANREMAEIEHWKGWAPEKLWLSPDCGMRRAVRYLAFGKLRAMVAGAKIVRHELMGRK